MVAQASKNGFLDVLDRETGKPIWPIPEREVPATACREKCCRRRSRSPPNLQRLSGSPIRSRKSTDLLTPEERANWTDAVNKSRNEGLDIPFSDKVLQDDDARPLRRCSPVQHLLRSDCRARDTSSRSTSPR